MAEPATIHLHYTHPHASGQGTTPPRANQGEMAWVRRRGRRRRDSLSDSHYSRSQLLLLVNVCVPVMCERMREEASVGEDQAIPISPQHHGWAGYRWRLLGNPQEIIINKIPKRVNFQWLYHVRLQRTPNTWKILDTFKPMLDLGLP